MAVYQIDENWFFLSLKHIKLFLSMMEIGLTWSVGNLDWISRYKLLLYQIVFHSVIVYHIVIFIIANTF